MNKLSHKSLLILGIMLCQYSLAEDRLTPVSVAKVEIAPIYDEIPLTGSVTARRIARISPRVEGFLSQMLADEGDEVETGKTLAQLDSVLAEIGLSTVQARVAEALAELDEARRQRDEAKELLHKKHISPTSFEARQAEVSIKSAVLSRLRSELEQQREIFDRHLVSAPFSGVISKKEVEIGQWVETSTTLFELIEISVLRIDVPVPQVYFDEIEVGTAVSIKFDAFPEHAYDANVSIKIPSASASTRTFPVRIEMQNPGSAIAPGMSARVRFRLESSGQAKLVERDALIRKPDGGVSLWKITEVNGITRAKSIEIKAGRTLRDKVEVISNELQIDDIIVIRGNEILQEGQKVRIVRADNLKP
ncbi:MAG: efflux RND transporter periplasmic adaptor subunit [Gammaproteobacteria bacterium]|nr:efflux RND transporter periplasmic adaptor subunit [Gammaproteobacteria bacterium]